MRLPSRVWLPLTLAAFLLSTTLTGCGSGGPLGSTVTTSPVSVSSQSPAPSSTPAGSARWVPAASVPAVTLGLLAQARHTVDVEMYELGNPVLVAALIADARRGIAVRVILDATEAQSVAAVPLLRAGGVQVETVTVPHGGIDHVKLLVVDGHTALTGGVNWGVASTDTTDADVWLASDPAAAETFAEDWTTAQGHPASGAWPDPAGSGALSGAAIQPAMVALIAHATGPVDVAANYLTDYAIQDALTAAAGRGIPVHVVINPTAYGAAAATRWLTDHGVMVRDAPATPYLHAKVLLAGDTGLIGSANFSYDALSARNHEFDVALPASVVPAADAWFAALWARSTPVT
jgi:cardiolipin synthase